jgi:L-serine/L-threonine ammonia-lyase
VGVGLLLPAPQSPFTTPSSKIMKEGLLRHWLAGNSTIIDELFDDFEGSPPDAIVCSVGGGGLLNGIMLGLDRCGWGDKVTVLALETEGADCLSRSLQAGAQVTMQEITSIARSLGVSRVSDKTWDLVQKHPNIRSIVLRDADAARACVRFAEEQKMIVEPACGVCLAMLYDDLLEELIPGLGPNSKVVVIVCGGEREAWVCCWES